jgi:TatA/E family protein of Tat protein translocase
MFNIGTQEVLVILLVALLLFGGRRIPELARSLGRGIHEFRKAVGDIQRQVDLPELKEPLESSPRRPVRDEEGEGGPGDEQPRGERQAERGGAGEA